MTNLLLIIAGLVVIAILALFGLFGLVSAHGGGAQPAVQTSVTVQ